MNKILIGVGIIGLCIVVYREYSKNKNKEPKVKIKNK
jgi:mannose/fructose/N-acetylgalactosamine-specific phosphotransferase system component IIC